MPRPRFREGSVELLSRCMSIHGRKARCKEGLIMRQEEKDGSWVLELGNYLF